MFLPKTRSVISFLVEIPNTSLVNINRINTWLTCSGNTDVWWGCPSVIGGSNVWRIGNLKFGVQIQRGGYLPGFDRYGQISIFEAQENDYQIHYVVEGTCA